MNDVKHTPAPQSSSLEADEYHLIVSPVLQVAAELAAVRGDPDLYNDMPTMLALRTLVQRFGGFYLEQNPDTPNKEREAIRDAADGACLMALERSELDRTQTLECMWALNAASSQLAEAGVIGPEQELARTAWRQLCGGNRKNALAKLKLAAGSLVTAIDQWERQRQESPQQEAPHP